MELFKYLGRLAPLDKEVGLEIEMEGSGLRPRGVNYWNITQDNSLRANPESAEYVLKSPVKRERVGPRLSYLQKKLFDNDALLNPSDRCGVHVHINCQAMTLEQLFKFISLYLVFEHPLTRWCGEEREGNLFCLRASDADHLIDVLVNAREQGSFRPLTANNQMRYSAMNLASLGKYGSLEFRAMRTPKDFNVIHKWVKLLLRIRDKSQGAEDIREFVEGVSQRGAPAFARHVMGNYLNDINCDDLQDMLLNGVRLVQNYAYIPLAEAKAEKAPRFAIGLEPPRLRKQRQVRIKPKQGRLVQPDVNFNKAPANDRGQPPGAVGMDELKQAYIDHVRKVQREREEEILRRQAAAEANRLWGVQLEPWVPQREVPGARPRAPLPEARWFPLQREPREDRN